MTSDKRKGTSESEHKKKYLSIVKSMELFHVDSTQIWLLLMCKHFSFIASSYQSHVLHRFQHVKVPDSLNGRRVPEEEHERYQQSATIAEPNHERSLSSEKIKAKQKYTKHVISLQNIKII